MLYTQTEAYKPSKPEAKQSAICINEMSTGTEAKHRSGVT